MTKTRLRIGTRGSPLALWQARWVQKCVTALRPDVVAELTVIKTRGDKILDVPLAKVGGKGLFVKEIEEALLDGRIDLAVHSMKDMPAELPVGLRIGATPERENPLDALVSLAYPSVEALPEYAKVGTSSLRRAAQLLSLRPDLKIMPLRGNVGTRLEKLSTTSLDAIILAAAGLMRLGWADRISALLDTNTMLPAVGQGALGVEIRTPDRVMDPIVARLQHDPTQTAVAAERAFLHRLEGGCQVPIAAHAVIASQRVKLTGLVATVDGRRVIKNTIQGPCDQAQIVGTRLAEDLLARGADEILERLKHNVA